MSWIFNEVAVVKGLIYLLDLPGQLTTDHVSMCAALCRNGMECMGSKDFIAWAGIGRFQISYYIGGWSLYFCFIAIPCAGGIFGAWLAFTLTLFKGQWNEGFSSLRIQHWKNFIRCHIKKNGDLEIFAVGLDRVPRMWVMDEEWGGTKAEKGKRQRERTKNELVSGLDEEGDTPSFLWSKPSKWVAEKKEHTHMPRLIDRTVIRKRVAVSRDEEDKSDATREGPQSEKKAGRVALEKKPSLSSLFDLAS